VSVHESPAIIDNGSLANVNRYRLSLMSAKFPLSLTTYFNHKRFRVQPSIMPMFQNSQNTDARGGTFSDVAGDQVNIGQVINSTNNPGAIQSY
jgi:hypothetical protein